ncbi:MAG: hypothetical protein HYY50_04760 [Candidatus Kerfeldbacteria bacterium]|nr:hypothetical protein [Candidatus Kerfeldbacteria bacterium]
MPEKRTATTVETKRRTAVTTFLVLSVGVIVAAILGWMYLFSGPAK